jgi:hypothetical protein
MPVLSTYHQEFVGHRFLPAVLTGPEYIISTIDRVHDLRRGTLCGVDEDVCEEKLPDGKYIFRVTGALSLTDTQNTTKWEFCHREGTSQEELEFKLIKGRCFPGAQVTANEFCCHEPDFLSTFTGLVTLSGVSYETLSEYDLSLLEEDIMESLSSVVTKFYGTVHVTSTVLSGSNLLVSFSFQLNPALYGVSGVHYTEMDSFNEVLSSAMSAYIAAGTFKSHIDAGLAGSVDLLSSISAVALTELKFVDTVRFSDKSVVEVAVEYAHSADSLPAVSVSSSKASLQSFSNTVVYVLIALTAGGLLVMLVSSITTFRNQHTALPTMDMSSSDGKTGASVKLANSGEIIPDFQS